MRRGAAKRALSRLAAMAGRPQIALLACLCAAVPAGCGSNEEGTIPSSNSQQMITLLDAVDEDVASGDCDLAESHAREFVDAVNLLPAEVDDEVKGGLQDAAARLVDLSTDPDQCEATTGDSGVGGVDPTTETTTTTTPPPTTETTTDTDDEEDQPPPPDDNSGEGGGGPGSSGGGGGSGGDPGSEGEVTIEPPSDEGPTSGGIGGDKDQQP